MLTKKTVDLRKTKGVLKGGRRSGENNNPFMSARRTWNDHMQGMAASRLMWQIMGVLSLLVALTSIGGIIHIGNQSRFIPYVIEVDKLGQPMAIAAADKAMPLDERIVKATIAQFIVDSRTVTPDSTIQRRMVFDVYGKLNKDDPAAQKMNDWFNSSDDASPFKRAETKMVSVEIRNVMPQSKETWQVDWVETIRDRSGAMSATPMNMRALVTIYIVTPSPNTTEEQLQKNPIGLFVRNFTWSQLVN